MTSRQLLLLALTLLALHVFPAVDSVPMCPRSLDTVLASTSCSGHRQRLLTASRKTIESTSGQDVGSVQDVCLDSLRALLATTASLPCHANVNAATPSGHTRMRRLDTEYVNLPFDGKLNCTFDQTAPLNLSNPTQPFIMDCTEIPGPYNYTWLWWVLGGVGGIIAIAVCCIVVARCRS